MIQGVGTKQLHSICDERGRLMEILRSDEPIFKGFGQVYLTTTYPGVVKAWHLHRLQEDTVCCIRGEVQMILYDPRDDSPTRGEVNEFVIGEDHPLLVSIPAGIYHGWKCVSPGEAFVINIPTEPYNREQPDEYRLPPDSGEIPYRWVLTPGLKHG
jgi:dTDP-4-dehydrorhamnose 3,5-epimerase